MTDEQKEHLRAFITALRSGEYQQTQGTFHRTDNVFCAEGVMCELYRKFTGKGSWVPGYGGEAGIFELEGNRAGGWLYTDHPVAEFFGRPRYLGDSLQTANDSGVSFRQIADQLEEQYL